MDFEMPIMNGIISTQKIRAFEWMQMFIHLKASRAIHIEESLVPSSITSIDTPFASFDFDVPCDPVAFAEL